MTAAARFPARNDPANNQFANYNRADLIFNPIVVDWQLPIIEIPRERLPSL